MMWRWASIKPDMTVMPRASIARAVWAPEASLDTEAMRPPRTTSTPRSMTSPVPTMIRAFVMVRSWATRVWVQSKAISQPTAPAQGFGFMRHSLHGIVHLDLLAANRTPLPDV